MLDLDRFFDLLDANSETAVDEDMLEALATPEDPQAVMDR